MPPRYDVLIENTRIIDGTGRPAFRGSVGISGERIAALGSTGGDAARVIDGTGLVTCPGFVDPHTHMCFAKRREEEFSLRMEGMEYLEILR